MVHFTEKTLALSIARILHSKKAEHTALIALPPERGLCPYMVVATARNRIHLHALLQDVEDGVRKQTHEVPRAVEGIHADSWVVLDYGCVLVHICTAEIRTLYRLEYIWEDTSVQYVDDCTFADKDELSFENSCANDVRLTK
ncbi:ribosome silencing factor [Fannyhessea vaginae]|uniref:ribosome silencing factor n=1 Tax=Fannyhessea vaginae TaxID=82135 RepID=UPI00336A7865